MYLRSRPYRPVIRLRLPVFFPTGVIGEITETLFVHNGDLLPDEMTRLRDERMTMKGAILAGLMKTRTVYIVL